MICIRKIFLLIACFFVFVNASISQTILTPEIPIILKDGSKLEIIAFDGNNSTVNLVRGDELLDAQPISANGTYSYGDIQIEFGNMGLDEKGNPFAFVNQITEPEKSVTRQAPTDPCAEMRSELASLAGQYRTLNEEYTNDLDSQTFLEGGFNHLNEQEQQLQEVRDQFDSLYQQFEDSGC